MSGPGIGRGSSTRTVRKIEAPRPLKTTPTNDTKNKPSLSPLVLPANAIDSAEKLLLFMDAVVTGIMSDDEQSLKPENKALLTANIVSLCENLKIYGPQLENTKYQGHLDRAFMTFRQGMVCNHLEVQARYHLLNILELRECHWSTPKSPKALNMKSQNQSLDEDPPHMKLQPFSPVQVEPTVHLGPDEIIKSSGKYRDKPSKPSKNYCKEEIIIRNSDSGKVMGIKGRRVHMIEQLSETIISFQKVQPTFKERLVQITGPTEENVSYASQLIEQTIRNNSSPVRELGESDSSYSSDESGEKPGIRENSFLDDSTNWNWQNEGYQFKHKVSFNDCVLTLTGNDYYFVTMAKSVLDNYFSKLTPAEYLNYYNTCDNSVGEPVVWENEVLAEGNEVPTIDLTSDKVDIYGAGDAEEDHILKQLHYDLNNMNIEPSSLTSGTVSFSDTIDEIAEPLEDDKPADNDYTKIVYTKEFLLECRKKAISQREPENWQWVKSQYPAIVKTPDEYMPDVKATVNDTPLEEDESVDQTRPVEENEVVKNQNALDEIL